MAKTTQKMDDLFDDKDFSDDDLLTDPADDTVPPKYNINDNLWETLEKNLPKNTPKLMRWISKYRDANIETLETPYPLSYPVWTPKCESIMYESVGFSLDDLYQYTKDVEGPGGYIDKAARRGNLQTQNTTQYLMWMILRYYLLNNKQREATIMKYYMGYFYYMGAFTNYFRGYKPNKDVMMYVVNNLSYRVKLKSLGSVHKWIYYGMDAHTTSYEKKILRGADYDYLCTLNKCRERFHGYLHIIKRDYEANKDTNRIYTQKTFINEGEGLQYENGSVITDIIGIADQYTSAFFQHPISENAIKFAVNKSNKAGWIPEKDLRNTIYMIADNPDNQDDVRAFYQALFYVFFHLPNKNYERSDIHSRQFIVEMQKTYKPGNSNDANRIIIRDMIDKWLTVGSRTYRSTNRTVTITIFRRAIFDYFIFKTATD